jgi:hypothetical protein
LGPVLTPVTQFIPPNFPLLLIVPAFAIDMLRPRLRGFNRWLQAAMLGSAFLVLFLAAQWWFANFLMTHAAANGFFGTMYRDYLTPPDSIEAGKRFVGREHNFWTLMVIAWAVAMGTSRAGVGWGEWMRTVQR